MTDTQQSPTVFERIGAQNDALPYLAGERPAHSMLFITADGDDLMELDADGMMPIPAVGDSVDPEASRVQERC